MEERQLTREEIDAQIAYYEESIKFGEAMEKLSKDKNFKLLEQRFVNDFALGQLNNAHNYNDKGDERFLINYKARAVFKTFIKESIEQGINSIQELKDFREALKDEGYDEE